jgi:hypothetical protein
MRRTYRSSHRRAKFSASDPHTRTSARYGFPPRLSRGIGAALRFPAEPAALSSRRAVHPPAIPREEPVETPRKPAARPRRIMGKDEEYSGCVFMIGIVAFGCVLILAIAVLGR